jgi:CHAT domain-containing protein
VDLLASTRFSLSAEGAVGADEPALAADWEKYRQWRQEIDNLLVQLTGDQGETRGMTGMTGMTIERAGEASGSQESERIPSDVLYAQLRATQEEAAAHWEEMTFKYPALTACESAPSLTAQEARDLSAQLGATLVEYYQHAEGWCAFVVTPDEVRYVALPYVTDDLIELMRNWSRRIEKAKCRNQASYRRLSKWYQAVIEPLNLPKGEAKAVVLAPFGPLHMLPLTAARHPQSLQYVSEEHALAFVPSLGALSVAVKERINEQSLPTTWKQALLVAYPGHPPLDNVLPEAEAIANYFPEPTPLHKKAATPDEVVKEARGKQVIHFGCHGWFDSQQPEQSGLMLADGWLTVQRIITDLRLKQCQLTTLGACQSGRTALGSGDEHVGLIQALMTAGTASVVASLWSVNDASTSAFFGAFYAEINKGEPPAIALRQAAEEVRDVAQMQK